MVKPSSGRPVYLLAHPSADLYGSDRVMLETLVGLVETGAKVIVTLPESGPLVSEIEARGGAVVLCPTPVLRKSMLTPLGLVALVGRSIGGTIAAIRLIRHERPVAIYVSTITIPLWLVVAKLTRLPSLCHVHEAEASARPIVRKLLALPLTLATSIVANSNFSVRVLKDSIASVGERAVVVYNGVKGPSTVVPPRAEIAGGLRVLYVGRLSPRKGVDLVVDAVAALTRSGKEVQLSLLGAVFPGYEWYLDELHARVEAAGLHDQVRFLGFREDVWADVSGADVVVVPSRIDEPFGNTAVEAVLASRPVIVSDTSGLREAAAGYRSAVFVSPDSAVELAAALDDVAAHWTTFRADAIDDERIAHDRHSVASYRVRIAAQMNALTGTIPLASNRIDS